MKRILNELEAAEGGLTFTELGRRTGMRLHDLRWALEMLADQGRLCRIGNEPTNMPECDDCEVAGLCAHSPAGGFALQNPKVGRGDGD